MTFLATRFLFMSHNTYYSTNSENHQIRMAMVKVRENVQPVSSIDLSRIYPHKTLWKTFYPLTINDDFTTDTKPTDYSSQTGCWSNVAARALSRKFILWEKFRCNESFSLPINFLHTPPYMHPAGESFALLALKFKRKIKDTRREQLDLSLFHITELSKLKQMGATLKDPFSLLSTIKSNELAPLADWPVAFLANQLLFVPRFTPTVIATGRRIYDLYKLSEVNEYLLKTPYVLSTYTQNQSCLYNKSNLCYRHNFKHLFKLANKNSIALFILSTLIVILVVWALIRKLKAQKEDENHRRLALQILTHEFRTPITSMLLLTDNISKQFDLLPSSLQDSFMALSTNVYRMQRLAQTSKNYLKLGHKGVSSSDVKKIDSLNDFMANTLSNYAEQVELIPLKEDLSLHLPGYWIGICLKNLVENAIFHGARPIKVWANKSGKEIQIKIQDGGVCEFGNIDDIAEEFVKGPKSEGTGLGLAIVSKVMKQIGGKLEFQTNPTIFSLHFKSENKEQ